MLNSKETLKKLHKKFPQLSLDDLFDILDCYTYESMINFDPNKLWTSPDIKIKNPYQQYVTRTDGTSTAQLTAIH